MTSASGEDDSKNAKIEKRAIEIFNVASEGGYMNKYWCAAYEVIGTAFLLLAVNWGTISG